MRHASALAFAAFLATSIAVPVSHSNNGMRDSLTQLAIEHPEVKSAVESVIQAEYGGLRPAKRETGPDIRASLTQLAVEHPEVKSAVESVIQAEYGGLRPANM
ncbi:hypothetical protein HIM_04244 [Hirsutella minnesotensis 3608]|uniref:Uncharacterized protein n=1 Tax=Hirsutella minnesotensis 3608 TaxID=1043627 RepID=A0A0F7ZQ26_9HYPO|nr:hypothetical protein HIM_04244 [Hirsutella minnesotensis 3608]